MPGNNKERKRFTLIKEAHQEGESKTIDIATKSYIQAECYVALACGSKVTLCLLLSGISYKLDFQHNGWNSDEYMKEMRRPKKSTSLFVSCN